MHPQGRPAQIIRQHADLSRRAEEALLWVLARMPTDQEKVQAVEFLKTSSSAQQGMEGLFRTLMLSDQLILNY